jgi:hypothetical protein
MRTAVARHHYVHSRGRCASDVIDIELVLIFSDARARRRPGDPRGACLGPARGAREPSCLRPGSDGLSAPDGFGEMRSHREILQSPQAWIEASTVMVIVAMMKVPCLSEPGDLVISILAEKIQAPARLQVEVQRCQRRRMSGKSYVTPFRHDFLWPSRTVSPTSFMSRWSGELTYMLRKEPGFIRRRQ